MRAFYITPGHMFTLYLTIESLTIQVITGGDENELTDIGTTWVETGHIPRPFAASNIPRDSLS
jgi:hypothetical protein